MKETTGCHLPGNAVPLGIVIPVYNEAENIGNTLSSIREKVHTPHMIYIVYDFDEDNTLPVARAFAGGDTSIQFVKNTSRGVVNAIKTGLRTAEEDYLLVTMADMSDDYSVVDDMCKLMDDGFDLVCGSRYMKGGRQVGGPLIKKTISRTVGISLRLIAGVPTHDATNSFKLYRKSMLDRIEIESDGGFEIGLEVLVKAHFSGFRVTEIPCTWTDREQGKSRFKIIKWAPKYLKWYLYALKKSFSVASYLSGIFFLCSMIFLSFSLLKGFNGSIVDVHGFRQTQTAITVRYLLKGGPWLAYETPVLGPPWSIPFEFPLYQWLVALTARTGLFHMEQAGRAVSIVFFLSTFYPFYKILRILSLKRSSAYLILGLYCLSPQYLFWSRTFMIESTALSLSMFYLWFGLLWYTHNHSPGKNKLILTGLAVAGSLAAAVKITTFFPFWTAVFALSLWKLLKTDDGTRWERSRLLPLIKSVVAAFVIPLAALLLWTSYSDALKSLNPLAQTLTSSALREWNFGTILQRLDPATWKLFFSRTVSDLVGNRWLLVAAAFAALFCSRKRRTAFFLLLLLFVVPLLTFTNLYRIHNYYAYANGVFLIAAVGIASSGLLESKGNLRQAAGVLLACGMIVFSVRHYLTSFYPVQGMKTADFSAARNEIGLATNESDVVVVFSDDWSSEIPYFLNRRAVMIGSNDLTAPSFLKAKQNLEGYRIGAIIFTINQDLTRNFIRNALSQFGFSSRYWHSFSSMIIFYDPYNRFR